MPELSKRAKRAPESPIRKLAPFADQAAKRGIKIYHLNIGQPDIDSPETFWKAVRDPSRKVLAYSPSQGLPELREKLAARYRSIGIDVQAQHIITCTAGSEALIFSMLSCLNPGDEVIVPEPMYANYIGFATIADVNVVPITTRIEDGFALPSVEAFAAKVTDRTKAILINNPGNPTGTVYTDEQIEGLRRLAIEHDLFLIADEVYREFNFTGRRIKSVLEMEGLEKNAVMIDSASKMYSLCGARVGFLVSRNPEVTGAALRFAQARLSPPTLEQYGMIGALDTPQSYLDGVRDEYMKRRDLLVSRLRAMPGVVCPDINGAFYATVRLPVDDADKFCQWLLSDFSHEGRTIMFAPASGFYETPGLGKDEVRIAYVLNVDDLGKAMDCLEAALAAYPGSLIKA
ncbi:MAG TPA: pyridoxal phosphate-dependent aminotransferase [Fimbriimonadaceae bacterium]|nr:pyridoxal phosphate-dependent aminotransferase [Fimbriimonadaceae bacterium]